jgi:hypothetical protein
VQLKGAQAAATQPAGARHLPHRVQDEQSQGPGCVTRSGLDWTLTFRTGLEQYVLPWPWLASSVAAVEPRLPSNAYRVDRERPQEVLSSGTRRRLSACANRRRGCWR